MPKVYENGGKLYEALISFVLDREHIEYHWEETLPGVGVVSDFVLYRDGAPYMVLLVTHSNAESGTHMKFWRNIDELFDLKTFNPELIVSNITFFSSWKPELSKIESAVFDSDFNLSEKEYATALDSSTIYMLPQIAGKSKKDTVLYVQKAFLSDSTFHNLFIQFEKDFRASVLSTSAKTSLLPLWREEQNRIKTPQPFVCRINDTWYKCGLIKLAFFSEAERRQIYAHVLNKSPIPDGLKQKAQSFFAGTARIGVFDTHIDYVIKQTSPELLETVITQLETDNGDKLTSILAVGRESSALIDFINNDIAAILSLPRNEAAEYATERIKSCYSPDIPKRNTFLNFCFLLCKYLDNRFSYDVAVRESGIERGTGPQRLGGIDKCLLGEILLDDKSLFALSSVLVDRMKLESDYERALNDILRNSIHQSYVTLVKHRTINYLHALIEQKLSSLGWKIEEREPKFRSCLSDYADAPLNTGDVSFTYSISRNGKNILLQVICAYTATHKHKELPGKLRAIRYVCKKDDNGEIKIDHNPNFKYDSAILLLDGCWSSLFSNAQKISDAFQKSGWSRVVCIDEFMGLSSLD